MQMPLHPTALDIAVRLLLTLIAGALIGINRETRGHAAGLRTTILICLAASVAMIQANLLLDVVGKTQESFSRMDIMRLPLGILTGVGFIGAGSIFKRGALVTGVTTAATLWIATVIGLCLGGGQLVLGMAATLLCLFTVWCLKTIDLKISREKHAVVEIDTEVSKTTPPDIQFFINTRYTARFIQFIRDEKAEKNKFLYEISWNAPEKASPPIDLIQALEKNFNVGSFILKLEPIKHVF
jgi:putative Mg2+ transporter-C (MgtC) family protein